MRFVRVRLQCGLEETLNEARLEFRFLVAFLLSGFVAYTVSMWTRRRSNYASLCGCTRSLLLQLASLLPDDGATATSATRTTTCRWVMLGFELAVLKARGAMDSDEGRRFLEAEGLLAEDEWESMVPGDRHTTCFFWVQLALRRLADGNAISQHVLCHCAASIADMRAQANDLMSSLDRDTPYPYLALAGFLVEVNLFLMSTWKGLLWSQWFATGGATIFALPKFWADVATLFLWNLSYQGMYDLAYYLWNPFLDRRIDVAHEAIGGGLRALCARLCAPSVPPTMATATSMAAAANAKQQGCGTSSTSGINAQKRKERRNRYVAEEGERCARVSRARARRVERGQDTSIEHEEERRPAGLAHRSSPHRCWHRTSAPRASSSKDSPTVGAQSRQPLPLAV